MLLADSCQQHFMKEIFIAAINNQILTLVGNIVLVAVPFTWSSQVAVMCSVRASNNMTLPG